MNKALLYRATISNHLPQHSVSRRVLLFDFSREFSVAQIISWAAERETTWEEDIAHCIFGLLGVNILVVR